jgi:hypothetical protein
MSRDQLTNLLNDRYGSLRITAPKTNSAENSLSVDRNPRLLYLSRRLIHFIIFKVSI